MKESHNSYMITVTESVNLYSALTLVDVYKKKIEQFIIQYKILSLRHIIVGISNQV